MPGTRSITTAETSRRPPQATSVCRSSGSLAGTEAHRRPALALGRRLPLTGGCRSDAAHPRGFSRTRPRRPSERVAPPSPRAAEPRASPTAPRGAAARRPHQACGERLRIGARWGIAPQPGSLDDLRVASVTSQHPNHICRSSSSWGHSSLTADSEPARRRARSTSRAGADRRPGFGPRLDRNGPAAARTSSMTREDSAMTAVLEA